MNRFRSALRPFIGSRAFYRDALSVMIPVTIQQLINNLFNMVDSLMVGRLDVEGLAMNAVTVANKPYDIFCGILFGMTGAAGLMISQYFGANDRKTCQGLFSLQAVLSVTFSLIFFAVLKLAPEGVMRIFVGDARTVGLGMDYMRVIAYSYIPVAVSSVCIYSMRSIGQNKLGMLVGMATMALNAVFNYVLIFGKLGFTAMGVVGAAWGTLCSRTIEMGLYIALLARGRMYYTLDLSAFLRLPKKVVRSFALKALPLTSNELLWTFGMSAYFWCYSHLNEAALPAVTIAEQCNLIAAVMSMGTSSVVAVLIGSELGAGRIGQAKANCKKLLTLVFCISLLCALLCGTLGFVLPGAFSVSPELKALATKVALTYAILGPLKFVYGFCFFCLRAGGDTRNAMLLDSGYMWLLPVPVSLLMGALLPGKISILAAAAIIQLLMNSKVFLALHVLRKGKWLRNITTESA